LVHTLTVALKNKRAWHVEMVRKIQEVNIKTDHLKKDTVIKLWDVHHLTEQKFN
jgi:hypothetical protein